jgi:hypothetical protein
MIVSCYLQCANFCELFAQFWGFFCLENWQSYNPANNWAIAAHYLEWEHEHLAHPLLEEYVFLQNVAGQIFG